jgi:enoyl-[acyl-carrier protein] reductase I
MGLLDGKKAVIFGIANDRSIAWAIAEAFRNEGAELARLCHEAERGETLAESIERSGAPVT